MRNFLFNRTKRGTEWWGHNTLYDCNVLLGNEGPTFFEPLAKKSNRLLFAVKKIGGGRITVLDTMNHIPKSLGAIGEMFGLEKLPGFDMAHCVRDCEITHALVKAQRETCKEMNCRMSPTTAGMGLDYYRRNHWSGPGWTRLSEYYYDFLCRAYYGGWTDVGRVGEYRGSFFQYDINSAYLYALATGIYPYPATIRPAVESDILRFEGVSEVDIEIDRPILPVRDPKRGLILPIGRIRGVYSHLLLRRALMDGGRIKRFWKGLSYDKSAPMFEAMGRLLYEMRSWSAMHKIWGKRAGNGFYGKVGQKRVVEEYNPESGVYETVKTDIPLHTCLIWSLYTTDYARLLLMEKLQGSYYWDTDCSILPHEIPSGDGLGEWKIEGEFSSVDIRSPKSYIAETILGRLKARFKGVPKRAYLNEKGGEVDRAKVAAMMRGEEVHYTRPRGLSSSLLARARGEDLHPAQWIPDKKRLALTQKKRNIGSGGWTYPLTLEMF